MSAVSCLVKFGRGGEMMKSLSGNIFISFLEQQNIRYCTGSGGCEGATAEVVYEYIVSQGGIAAEETLIVPLISSRMFHCCYEELFLLLQGICATAWTQEENAHTLSLNRT
eukprot:8195251-Ditylum_brightwellii.AAC.1